MLSDRAGEADLPFPKQTQLYIPWLETKSLPYSTMSGSKAMESSSTTAPTPPLRFWPLHHRICCPLFVKRVLGDLEVNMMAQMPMVGLSQPGLETSRPSPPYYPGFFDE
jgi:hypothetical protein